MVALDFVALIHPIRFGGKDHEFLHSTDFDALVSNENFINIEWADGTVVIPWSNVKYARV